MEDVQKAFETIPKQYPMLRDSNQIVRVHLLQYLWKETLGFLLHPDISPNIKRIADTGTATGLWLCDLQKTRPDIDKLDGFDISSESFIKPRDLPGSVSLHVLDINQPVPEAFKGQYDVVHLRLVRPAILNGDPSLAISHILDLLRPGGYVQWEEFDSTKIDLLIGEDVAKPSSLEAVAQMLGSQRAEWVAELPQILEARGFKTVSVERKNVAPWHRLLMSYLICQVITEISYANFDVSGPPGLGDKVRAQTAAALEEAMKGSYAGYTLQVLVAHKRF